MGKKRGIRTLFWLSAGFAAGVYTAVLSMKLPFLPLLAGIAAAIGGLCGFFRDYRLRILSLSLLGAAAGLLLSYTQLSFTLLPAENLSGETLEVECRVIELPRVYESSTSVEVRLCGENVPHVRCRLTLYGQELPEIGDELSATVRFSSARFRYGEESDTLTARGIFLRGTVKGEAVKTGVWKYSRLYAPRLLLRRIAERCTELFPEDVSAFHLALLTGEKQALYGDADLYNDLSRAGLMHISAVSGMHVSFLVGFLALLIPARRALSLVTLPFLLLFAALTGFTPSVCRAAFMQFILLLAPLVHREEDSLTSLGSALALLLCINPCSALSISLQLSFGAAAGILLFAPGLRQRMLAGLPERGIAGALCRTVCSILSASLGAMTFTLPLTALHFGLISLVSPLSNALCLWIVSLLFVGGYLTLGLGALSLPLGKAAGSVLAFGDRFVFAVARTLSALPGAAVYTENRLYLWWLLLAYVLLLTALLVSRLRKKEPPLLRVGSAVILTLCLCVGLQGLQRREPGLSVSVIDVGQGACTLLERGDAAVMVDCGSINTLDNAGDRAADYALSRGRRELSALILTHLHRDHCDGVGQLLSQLRVHRLYLPRGQEPAEEAEILALAERYGTEAVFVDDELCLSGEGLRLRLNAPPTFGDREAGLFVLGSCGEFDVLITGDADASMERRYVQLSPPGDIEILLVGHHGSSGSTAERFLDAVQADAAVISVGYNTYGHPTAATLERLAARNISVYRTDENGTVRIRGEENGSFQIEKHR